MPGLCGRELTFLRMVSETDTGRTSTQRCEGAKRFLREIPLNLSGAPRQEFNQKLCRTTFDTAVPLLAMVSFAPVLPKSIPSPKTPASPPRLRTGKESPESG